MTTTPAVAQEVTLSDAGSIDPVRFRPSFTNDGIITANSAFVPEHLHLNAGVWAAFHVKPLVVSVVNTDNTSQDVSLISNRADLHLNASLALWRWLQLGVEVPVTLFQDRSSNADSFGLQTLDAQGLGSIAVRPMLRLLRSTKNGLNLAVEAVITAPLAVPEDAYMGDTKPTYSPALLLSQTLNSFAWALNLGALLVNESSFGQIGLERDTALMAKLGLKLNLQTLLDIPVWLSTAADLFVSAQFAEFDADEHIGLSLYGALGVQANNWLGIQAGGGGGIFNDGLTPDISAFVSILIGRQTSDEDGDGIPDADDKCPKQPEDKDGFQDSDGCPDNDNDDDGVPDSTDKQPLVPEDLDGFQDEDGVPDPDNDNDGVEDANDPCPNDPGLPQTFGCPNVDTDGDGRIDGLDKCPASAEDKDNFEDDDGCPDDDNDADGVVDRNDGCPNEVGPIENRGCPDKDSDGDGVVDRLDNCPTVVGTAQNYGCKRRQLVRLTSERLEILKKVNFRRGSARISASSRRLLRNVARVLKSQPNIRFVRIEGHTDNIGSARRNTRLSQRRARAVRRFLIRAGIASTRLEAVGYGPDKPIGSNETRIGRAKNRRVEFVIVHDKEAKTGNNSP